MKRFAGYCFVLALVLTSTVSLWAQELTVIGADFDTTACNTKKCKKIVFRNDNATTQTLESIGALGSLFTLEDPAYNPPYTIAAKDSVAILFCYSAKTPGASDAEDIMLQLTGVAVQQKVTLKGKVVTPRMTLSSTTVDFGTIIVGTAKTISIVVTNSGDATLIVPNASGLAPPFFFTQGPGLVIAPGQSDTLNFLYVPTTEGTQNGTAVFAASQCMGTLSVTLTGTAVKTPAPTLGGVLSINPGIVDFDSTLCNTSKTLNVEFRNIGSDNVIIRSQMDSILTPFKGSVNPMTIAASASSTIQIAYRPTSVPSVDSQTIRFRADTRQSLSVGMLYDVSGSMSSGISSSDATQRLRAAKDAGKIFIAQLINDTQRNVVDRAQIMSFSSPASSFAIRSAFTTNRNESNTAIDALAASSSTCLYQSLINAINSVKTEPHPVLVLLSDGGEAGCDVHPTLADVLGQINTSGVRVFVVGITSSSDPLATTLQQIAAAGGGTATFARTQQELTNAFLGIANQLSQNIIVQFTLRGHAVAPLLSLNPSVVHFDSVRVGVKKTMSVSIKNNGDAPHSFNPSQFSGINPQFVIESLPVAALRPGESADMQLSFTPTNIRLQSTGGSFNYNICRTAIPVNADGIGYDSVVIALDTVINNARIGDTVLLPMRLQSLIPARYATDSLSISLQFNSTVLDAQRAQLNGTLSSVFTQQDFRASFSALNEVSNYTMRGGTLVNTVADSRLIAFPMTVLRGNNISSAVRVVGAQFADGNPKVGIIQPATVNLDTVCFLTQRLIDPSKRIGQNLSLLSVRADNLNAARLNYSCEQPCTLRFRVFDQLGRVVQSTASMNVTAGQHEQWFNFDVAMHGTLFFQAESDVENSAIILTLP